MLTFFIYFLITMNEMGQTMSFEKPGHCYGKMKRNICHCPPYGTDNCRDTCRSDYDCPGLGKCCYDVCHRVCVLPVTQRRSCPPPEVYEVCGPCKPDTCKPQPPRVNCTTDCVSGCYCPAGYKRTEDGRCIEQGKCPQLPPIRPPVCVSRHEVFSPCHTCDRSCANRNAEGCVNTCMSGCFCVDGYVRNGLGRCVSPNACPPPPSVLPRVPQTPTCPENQEFNPCRRICEPTCGNPSGSGCLRKCQPGCFCRSPLVRDYTGNCIPLETCPVIVTETPKCTGPNQKYIVCNQKCQATCDNPQGLKCNRKCVTGCFCIDNYVWHDDRCIPENECPVPTLMPPPPTPSLPICENEREEYKICGCQKSCEHPYGVGCDTNRCVSGCFCRDNYVRDPQGHCIPLVMCPSPPCGEHETYEICGPNCQDTCNGKVDCVPQGVCNSGCYCVEGYVKNTTDNTCVPSFRCNTRRNCPEGEEAIPCGQSCQTQCHSGFHSPSCPANCRQSCCRRRRR